VRIAGPKRRDGREGANHVTDCPEADDQNAARARRLGQGIDAGDDGQPRRGDVPRVG
jgi:hypothetical protein